MEANETQIAGQHYRASMQTWDYILAHNLGFLEGNVIKYVTRYRKKDGIQDLLKAKHYLDKLIEVENERLRRASNQNDQDQQTATDSTVEPKDKHSQRVSDDVACREQAVVALRKRTEAGYGQPTDIAGIT